MKKLYSLLLSILVFSVLSAQSLPIDFETAIVTSDFIDFDGGTASVIDNPQSGSINTSSKVAQIIRDGGANFAGSKIELASNLDFSTLNTISMKVYTSAPIGTTIKIKLETSGGSAERDVQTTVSGQWEELMWDFTGTPANFNTIVFMFDFGNVGNGSSASTFLFDDVEQLFGGFQIDFPVDFEDPEVNYTVTDFEGNSSMISSDPEDPSNTVIKVVKPNQAGSSAGTTIGTPAGFATNLPLTLSSSKMNVRVWSPESGTPIRLKVEDSKDPTRTCETETNTTVSGGWEVLEFDFINNAPGTEFLSVGLDMGWTYNMASIFFNFGTDGATAGEKTYYFDDVKFGEKTLNVQNINSQEIKVYPNPTHDFWNVSSELYKIDKFEIYNLEGRLIQTQTVNDRNVSIDGTDLTKGVYIVKVLSNSEVRILNLNKI